MSIHARYVPSSLSGKNVVKGKKASEIVLEDGYPYLVPQSVAADRVTYRRTFTQSRTANERAAWSTMVLPFAATTVQIDGDVWVLVLLLVLLNAAIVLLSRSIMTGRHMTEKDRPGDKSVKKRNGKDEEANESNTH